jgi:hypothetical protein
MLSINTPLEYLLDKVISQDVIDKATGEILIAANTVVSAIMSLLVIYDDDQFAHINARDGQIQNPTMNHGKE